MRNFWFNEHDKMCTCPGSAGKLPISFGRPSSNVSAFNFIHFYSCRLSLCITLPPDEHTIEPFLSAAPMDRITDDNYNSTIDTMFGYTAMVISILIQKFFFFLINLLNHRKCIFSWEKIWWIHRLSKHSINSLRFNFHWKMPNSNSTRR